MTLSGPKVPVPRSARRQDRSALGSKNLRESSCPRGSNASADLAFSAHAQGPVLTPRSGQVTQ